MWAIAQQVLVPPSIPTTDGVVERPNRVAVHRQRRRPSVGSSATAVRGATSSSLERGRHLTDASQVVANPRRAAGSTVVSSYFRLFRWTTAPRGPHDEEHVMRIFTPALDIGSHINAPRSAAGAALPLSQTGPLRRKAPLSPRPRWVGTGRGASRPVSTIPPTKPCRRLSPHTAFQESTFPQAACCTARVIRVPCTACPSRFARSSPHACGSCGLLSVDSLAPFPLCAAFLRSEYYGASEAPAQG